MQTVEDVGFTRLDSKGLGSELAVAIKNDFTIIWDGTENIAFSARTHQQDEHVLASNSAVPEEFEKRVLDLERKWNWDREGGKAIRHGACIAAVEFVRRLRAIKFNLDLPRVSPSKRGAVALTWRTDIESLTVFFDRSKSSDLAYQREASDYTSETARDAASNIEHRILAL